jgi:hypothetical protein
MSRAVVTINCNDVLSDNARRSFQAAAARWDADYVELTEEHKPAEMHPIMMKLMLFELVPAERIFWIDGSDAIIRDDAPSPFAACPATHLGVVKDAQPRKPDYYPLVAQQKREWSVFNNVLNESLPFEKDYFNAGVMVLTRSSHARMCERAYADKVRVSDRVEWIDQTALNFAAARDHTRILLMDETWNYMHPEQVGHWDYMEHCVYHFAGSPERRTVIPKLDWRMSPADAPQREPRRMRELVRKVSVFSRPLRFLYWWLKLPIRVIRTRNRPADIDGGWSAGRP